MRKAAWAAGGVALVLALSACGSKTAGQGSPANAPGSAGDNSVTSLFTDAGQLASAAKQGTAKSKSAKFSMDVNAAGQDITANGEGLFDGANSAMSMTMDMPQGMGSMEMRLVDKTLYMKLPDSMRSMMGGASADSSKPWVAITPGGDDPISKALGGSFDSMSEQNDPSKTLDQISKAGTITRSEMTTLDGQTVSHYVLDMDMEKMLDELPGGLPAGVGDQLKGKNVHFPAELWLNSDQLPVQITMDMTSMLQAIGGSGLSGQTMKMTMKYTDWGTPVSVTAPPADEVSKFPN